MSRFASDTSVSSEKSRGEIERTLTRYGATAFMYGWDGPRAVIGFKAHERMLRFLLPMPEVGDKKYTRDGRGSLRSPEKRSKAHEQDCRQKWRALALVVKAKLEAVESGITTFESEFLAQIVLPNGQTMSEHAAPLIADAYASGTMPKLLPHLQ